MAAPNPPPPPPIYPSPYGPPLSPPLWSLPPPPGSPQTREGELRALGALRMAAILGIVGLLLGLVVPFALGYAEGTPNPFGAYSFIGPTGGANNTTVHVNANAVWTLFAVAAVGAAIGLAGLVFYRRCFVELRPFDSRFSIPATLAFLLMIGLLVLLGGIALVFNALISANGCVLHTAPGAPIPSCLSGLVGSLLGGLALLVIGAIMAIVGVIGVILGIYRVGDRYSSTLLKVAAIFYILPFLNVVGAILTLLEAGAVETRLRQGAPPSGGGPYAMGPPPPMFPPPYPPPPGR